MVALLEMKSIFLINKCVGETPLECIEKLRVDQNLGPVPLTYAGRLDPMAEGLLVVLVGEECKRKADWLGLDKVYETEFLLGVETDTHDVLGLVQDPKDRVATDFMISREQFETILRTLLGRRTQVYPAYSSKPHKGRPLFELARAGELPSEDEMPSREVEIYRIEVLDGRTLTASELEKQILKKIALMKGDFRQEEIAAKWRDFLKKHRDRNFQMFSLRVHCSSGTYIRSLAHEVGRRLSTSAIAFSIKRTQVGNFVLAASS